MTAIDLDTLRTAIAAVTGRDAPPFSPDTQLNQLHVDSLQLMEIIGHIEDQHGIEVDEDELVDLRTIDDLIEALNKTAT